MPIKAEKEKSSKIETLKLSQYASICKDLTTGEYNTITKDGCYIYSGFELNIALYWFYQQDGDIKL